MAGLLDYILSMMGGAAQAAPTAPSPSYDRYGGRLDYPDPYADSLYNVKSGAIGYTPKNQQMIPDEQARIMMNAMWSQPSGKF